LWQHKHIYCGIDHRYTKDHSKIGPSSENTARGSYFWQHNHAFVVLIINREKVIIKIKPSPENTIRGSYYGSIGHRYSKCHYKIEPNLKIPLEDLLCGKTTITMVVLANKRIKERIR
jgi:hypothetical protein